MNLWKDHLHVSHFEWKHENSDLFCIGLANTTPTAGLWVTKLVGAQTIWWASVCSCPTVKLISISFSLIQTHQYIQLWMPLLKHWWRMPWIVINIVTCRIPWINWILNMDCAAGVAFASIPSAYTHYCALWLCEWQSSADGASDKFPWWSYEGPITKGLCVFASAFCAGWAKAMVLSYSNYDVDERTHWI